MVEADDAGDERTVDDIRAGRLSGRSAWNKAPDKFHSRILVGGQPYRKGFDGTRGWNADNRGSHDAQGGELERLRQQAAFALPVTLRTFYPALTVDGETVIGSEPAVVLSAPGKGSERDRLFFIRDRDCCCESNPLPSVRLVCCLGVWTTKTIGA